MPKPRKPLAELELSGVTAKNPRRYAKRKVAADADVDDDGPGAPHPSLSPEEQAIWIEICESAPPRLLRKSDGLAVEITARLLAKFRTGSAKMSEVQTLTSMLSKLGLDPKAREAVTIPEPPREPDMWDKLLARTAHRV